VILSCSWAVLGAQQQILFVGVSSRCNVLPHTQNVRMVPVKWLLTGMTYLYPEFVFKFNSFFGHLPPELYIDLKIFNKNSTLKSRALAVFEGNSSIKGDRKGQWWIPRNIPSFGFLLQLESPVRGSDRYNRQMDLV